MLEVVPEAHALTLRLERFALYWQQSPVTLPPNTTLQVSSGGRGGSLWRGLLLLLLAAVLSAPLPPKATLQVSSGG